MTTEPQTASKKLRRDLVIAGCCGAFVALMVGAAYASVPLYDWFCRTTGFGGTPMVSEKGPEQVLDRTITVRFDSNVTHGLPWKFVPERNTIDVRLGDVVTVNYKVINQAARAITAQASYNVTPPQVGGYFNKINCFCFTEQTLKAGETREMAVVFYVDPKIVEDRDMNTLNTITLSYTFFPMREADRPLAATTDKNANKL